MKLDVIKMLNYFHLTPIFTTHFPEAPDKF